MSQNSTSTWLTYKNSKYGFEFQYPKSWDNIIESDDYSSLLLFNSANEASLYEKTGGTPEFYSGNTDYAIIDIGVAYEKGYIAGNNKTIVNENTDLKQFLLDQRHCTLARLKTITLGGVEAFQCAYVDHGFDFGAIWIKNNGNIFSIDERSGKDYINYQDLGNTFNTAISTFKFAK